MQLGIAAPCPQLSSISCRLSAKGVHVRSGSFVRHTRRPCLIAARDERRNGPPSLSSLDWPDLVEQVEVRVGRWSELGNTVLFSLGLILINYGVEGLLDEVLGEDDAVGAVACMVAGLAMVFWARLSGFKMLSLWSPNPQPQPQPQPQSQPQPQPQPQSQPQPQPQPRPQAPIEASLQREVPAQPATSTTSNG